MKHVGVESLLWMKIRKLPRSKTTQGQRKLIWSMGTETAGELYIDIMKI